MNIFVDENIEERYVEGLYEDFIFEEYEKIIFDYLVVFRSITDTL